MEREYLMNFFENKKILVTGGTGMVGMALIKLLKESGAKIRVVSIDNVSPFENQKDIEFIKLDLRNYDNCLKACNNMDVVFHVAGIKGSPAVALNKPASFFVPTITFNTNLLEAAVKSKASHILYTSSIGVYSPSSIFNEDDVWKTFPSENDRFAGWAKRMGELQMMAYEKELNFNNYSIIRPANIYGPYDNFDPKNAMVIPSLINKVLSSKDTIEVWGDGSAIRDFIFSRDVARGMMLAVEKKIKKPLNLGSGTGITIKQLINSIIKAIPNNNLKIKWDTSKPTGDKVRVMNMELASSFGFKCETNLEDGIKETVDWYLKNKNYSDKKFNSFKN